MGLTPKCVVEELEPLEHQNIGGGGIFMKSKVTLQHMFIQS